MAGPGIGVVKIVIQGKIGPTQTWSTGCYFSDTAHPAGATKLQLEAMGDSINTAVSNYAASTLHHLINNVASVTGWTAYSYGATSVKSVAENAYVFTTAATGAGAGSLPALTAMVQSLRTNSSGRSYRGRMYLPAQGATLDGYGRFAQADCTNMCNDTVTYLEAAAAAVGGGTGGGDSTPCVASFTKSFCTNVTEVLVDNIPDTQHRREDKLGATFTASGNVVIP